MRILLVKTSSLGDVIHNLPVASDIRRRFPGAQIDWVVEEGFAEIPRLHPAVARTFPVAVRRWRKQLFSAVTRAEIGTYRSAVSAEAYDAVIDTQGLMKSALLASQAQGCRHGHASPRERFARFFYNRTHEIPRSQNAVVRNRQLAAAALGYALDDLPLDYGISADPLAAGWLQHSCNAHYAVLLTATSRADKEWPEDRWLALGAALNAAGLACVLPGGSERERSRASRLADGMEHAVSAPAMNLTLLAGLMAGARIVIGVDTGLVHLAAALRRPTLAIYCGSDPALTGLLGTADFANLGSINHPPEAAEVARQAMAFLA